MRKTILNRLPPEASTGSHPWMDLDRLAQVEVTSEDAAHPIDHALIPGRSSGWLASSPGEQTIRILFDEPQAIRHVQLLFTTEGPERKQEFLLSWSADDRLPFREIVRQQFHFSPGGARRELEDYRVELEGVRVVELKINPDRDGGSSRASLAHLYFS